MTLDEDVAEQLNQLMKERGKPFKETVNDLLRLAIHTSRKPRKSEPFVVKPFQTGPLPGLNFDKIQDVFDQVDGPDRKW